MKYTPDLTLKDRDGLSAAVFASALKIDLNDAINRVRDLAEQLNRN